MSDPFVGEIRIFAGTYAPIGWAFCNGQLLPIAQNTALFSLLGTQYGGDGRSTFALPNFLDRVPIHWDQGPGLTSREVGNSGGSSNVTLTEAQMPAHNHGVSVSSDAATATVASSTLALGSAAGNTYGAAQNLVPLGNTVGGGQPHENRQPYLGLTFIIALQGIFPPRN